ncbi:TonB-dependent receptor domain-containing protein [Aurantiacibacter poecillastricola]|uniref:TonB-dependent receptor domain-containing protein n=1 Tax=Aurantiacibacter poecillastricola TaxID=3064385 RepID=UPI00273FCF05|nr:TonB-dependent receptor [Aurantiacibacter sp. 219JJ12-13]MDP5263039.1 TonB-dependent receptor [Aurantiacibacter sp. 219JJ12-13]
MTKANRLAARTCVAAIALGLLSTQSAQAQTVSTGTADEMEAEENAGETIVVTGSRIRSSFDQPTPVTMLGGERLEERGITNLGDALNELPAFSATQSAATAGLTPGPGLNIGGRILDLRGLGAVRTLTLVDGKRFVPSTTQATVDTNMIPSILLQRAEVVTGGASAVYGSDAVSGVVNLIIDRDFTGYRVNGQLGISNEDDNFTRQVGVAGGWDFGSSVHLVVGGEWEKADGIDACRERDWCIDGLTIVGRNPLAAGQSPDLPASNILPGASVWTTDFQGITTPPASAFTGVDLPVLRPIDGITFDNDGTPRRYQLGSYANRIWMVGGETGTPAEENVYFDFPIISPNERFSLMGLLTLDATPDLSFELGLTYGGSDGRHRSTAYRNIALTIQDDNPFIPRSADPTLDIPTILANSGATSFSLGKGFDDVGPVQIEATNRVFRLVAGAEYSISPDWTADFYYQFGRNSFRSDLRNNTITANILQALDATSLNGEPVCRVNADADPTNDDPSCVPLNPFGYANGPLFASAADYVTADGFQTSVTKQHVAALNISGSLFELPGGPLGVAFGGEFRNDSLSGDTDPISQTGGFFNAGNGSIISGEIEVVEGYAEFDAPILGDVPFASEFGISGAIRQTHYRRSSDFAQESTVDATTWKLGATWAPVEAVRFRVTRSRDIRAPNIPELFGPQSVRTGILTDVGNGGVQVIVPITSGSNPNLLPEKADTFTAGVVIQPETGFLSRLRASIDYYDIDIADAIGVLGQQNIVQRCVDGDQLSCSLIERDADNNVVSITDTVQNVNRLIARGVDFQLNYSQPLGGNNALSLVVLTSYVKDLITVDSVGSTDRAGQTGLRGGTPPGVPDWLVDATASLDIGDAFTFNTHVRWINSGFFFPSFIEPGDPGYALTDPNSVNTNSLPSKTYVDLLATYRLDLGFAERAEIYAGVDNVFNVDPPNFPGANGAGNNVLFNPVGRFFKGGVRLTF